MLKFAAFGKGYACTHSFAGSSQFIFSFRVAVHAMDPDKNYAAFGIKLTFEVKLADEVKVTMLGKSG